jgi:hypothetical protein
MAEAQRPSWVTTTLVPATWIAPVLGVFLRLRSTLNFTSPDPVLEVSLSSLIQSSSVDAFHPQPLAVRTSILPSPDSSLNSAASGVTVNEQAGTGPGSGSGGGGSGVGSGSGVGVGDGPGLGAGVGPGDGDGPGAGPGAGAGAGVPA